MPSLGQSMLFRETVFAALQLFGRRSRKTWFGPTRAQIELRDLEERELIALHAAAKKAFGEVPDVEWVEVNPYTKRLVVAYRPGRVSEATVLRAIESAEHDACCAAAAFPSQSTPHPADQDHLLRLAVELAADTVGLAIGAALRLTPIPASRIAGTLTSVTVIAKGAPRLRKPLDERFGTERADLFMSVLIAAGNGLAQRPIASLVDVAHRTALLREARSQHSVWCDREQELCARPSECAVGAIQVETRPVELPDGPIEEYANRAWVVALSGFLFSLLLTRSFYRATSALFGGVPKPARLGRDVYSAEIGRALARRSVLVLDPSALRRLDRLDCLILASDVLPQDRYAITTLHVVPGATALTARQAIDRLFDPDRPLERRVEGDQILIPLGLSPNVEDVLTPVAQDLAFAGQLVLALFHGPARVALASVELLPQTGLEELVAAAQRADMHVVVAGDSDLLERATVDERIDADRDLVEVVRTLQLQGRAVAVVARSNSEALAASDCGIGLLRAGDQTPWGAHIVCRDDLSDIRFLIEAAIVARQIARQSVNIALAAATMGALVSAGGILPLSTRRVVNVVNAATLISMLNGVRASRALSRQPEVPVRDRTPWHALESRAVMRRLGTSELGLSHSEVVRRRPTKVHTKSLLVEFAEDVSDELFNPLAPLLAAGAGLSAVAGSMGDAAMVGGVVVVNAVFSGYQRFRTERRIRDLTHVMRRTATVHRDGNIVNVDADDLVPGDVIVLSSGEVVPADCRILHAESLELDTSSLTGESLPVVRSAEPSFESATADRSSMLYEGTTIAAGRVTAIVVAIGMFTEAKRGGEVALRRPHHASGVEQRLRSLVNLTAPVALGAGASLVLAGLLRGRRVEHLVPAGVSLAVASVPEGLPLLATAAQLAAARRLMARGALVRNTRSIEALGRVDVLCLDKTGTLTEGRLEFVGVTHGGRFVGREELLDDERTILAAALRAAPDARYVMAHDDPTDAALLRSGESLGVSINLGRKGWVRAAELPFEPGRAYHAVAGIAENDHWLDVKGAPEVILAATTHVMVDGKLTPLTLALRRDIERVVEQLAHRGYRLLGVAERRLSFANAELLRELSELTLLGMVAFRDPVRATAGNALRRLRLTGVRALMITGDHPRTAAAIAEELNFVERRGLVTGPQLSAMTDEELDRCLDDVQLFARVTPSQKARIVRALQRKGRVVAMVGDGANDAPAIRLAQVGIAVGEQSTGAARSAADIVLTDERIETVVEAVIEGRAMWASVRDAVSILVGGNLGEIGFTLGAGLVDGRPPLNPRQLLLVNLLTDVAPAMAIALRPPSVERLERLAQEGPDASLGKPLNRDIAARAVITSVGAGMAWTVARVFGSRERASTVGLLALVGTQLGQTITAGGYSRPVITTSLLSSALLAAIVQTPGVSQFFGCQPLSPIGWSMAFGSSVLATSLAVSFPQVTALVAQRLRPIDTVLHEPPMKPIPTSVPPAPTVRAVQSVIQNEALLELVHRTGEWVE